MKRLFLLLGCLLVLVTGCGRKYRITLTNNKTMEVMGKPKYDQEENVYIYRSGGQTRYLPASRVRTVEPATSETTYIDEFEFK